jgi:hypothetical protein
MTILTQKPWAVGSLIVGSEWQEGNGGLFSTLRGGRTQPHFEALMAERYGRFPVVAGVRRRDQVLTLETMFMSLTTRKAYRKLILNALDADDESPFRLTIVDNVLPAVGPEQVLLAFGPWDVYYDGSDWKARGILEQAEGTLVTGWDIAPGEGLDISGSSALTLVNTDLTGVNTMEVLWKPADDNTYASDRYLLDDGTLELFFRAADDKFVTTDGVTTVISAAQTFAADTLIHVVVVWGSAYGLKLYVDGTETTGAANAVALAATVYVGTDTGTSLPERGELVAVRFYDVLTATQVGYLYAEVARVGDDPLGNARRVEALCEQVDDLTQGGTRTLDLISTLRVDGDPRWRSRDGDFWHWDVTSSGDQETVSVDTEAEVYPVLYITPKSARTGGLQYKSYVTLVWKADSASNYPIKLGALDTSTLIGAAKMQADGDDLRVYNGANEIDRWIQDINTATTDIWVVLEFDGTQTGTLSANIGNGDTVTSVQSDTDISQWPASGRFLLNSEVFTYRGKDDASRTFENVVRAARGTSAGNHTAGDTLNWLQHDLWVLYGDATLSAPTVDSDKEPIMEKDTSDNDTWVYEEFGENSISRPGGWQAEVLEGTDTDYYTANRVTDATPWEEVGVWAQQTSSLTTFGASRFWLFNPCGIASMNYTNGEIYWASGAGSWVADIVSSLDGVIWVSEYSEAGASGVWANWNQNETLDSGSLYGGLYAAALVSQGFTYTVRFEAADVSVGLNTTYTPDATIGSEQANYPMDCTIANAETESIQIQANVNVDDVLELDTDEKTLINLSEGDNLFGALTQVGGVRRAWLALVDGDNVLTYTETGLADVDVDLVWDRRYRE